MQNQVGCQADFTATSLAAFEWVMVTEAVEPSAATSYPTDISSNLATFINSPGGRILGQILEVNNDYYL